MLSAPMSIYSLGYVLADAIGTQVSGANNAICTGVYLQPGLFFGRYCLQTDVRSQQYYLNWGLFTVWVFFGRCYWHPGVRSQHCYLHLG